MTAALLWAALAVLLWPDARAERFRRVAFVGRPRGRRTSRLPRPAEFPVPLLAPAATVAVAAAVSTPLVALLAGVAALAVARSWAEASSSRRQEVRLAGLAEGLGALTAELRSGRGLPQATAAAVAACGDEESGRALAGAVRAPDPGAAARGGTDDQGGAGEQDEVTAAAGRISAAVRLSVRTGCSLADVVAAVDDDLQARLRHRRELRAATAGPRAGAALLAGLPVIGLAMGSGIGADPWHVLTATGAGQGLLATGVALELAGLAWSRQLVMRALR